MVKFMGEAGTQVTAGGDPRGPALRIRGPDDGDALTGVAQSSARAKAKPTSLTRVRVVRDLTSDLLCAETHCSLAGTVLRLGREP
jgi:hypothetical protein